MDELDRDVVVEREVTIDASPAEVWDALADDEQRERWLEEPEREIVVERSEPPHRLVWRWSGDGEPATRVEFTVVAAPAGTRVIVSERAPRFPIELLADRFAAVCA